MKFRGMGSKFSVCKGSNGFTGFTLSNQCPVYCIAYKLKF
jgi:hypothetical protein